jgi:hypothetical protein
VPSDPLAVAAAFLRALGDGERPRIEELRVLTTRDSFAAWGDFAWARNLLRGCQMVNHADYLDDEVAYARFVPSTVPAARISGPTTVPPRAIMTLVWSDDEGTWRVHALGDTHWRPAGTRLDDGT